MSRSTSSSFAARTCRYSAGDRSARRATSSPPLSAVSGVRREAPHRPEGALEAAEHLVERVGQPIQLVTRPAELEAAAQILGRDAPGGARHPVDRLERLARHERPPRRGEPQAEGNQNHEGLQVSRQRAMTAGLRPGHLDDLGRPAPANNGERHQAHLPRADPERLERGLAPLGALARRRGQRQRLTLQAGRAVGRHALGVDHLHELISKSGVEIRDRRRRARAAALGRDRFSDDLRQLEEHRVDVSRQRQRQQPVGKAAGHQEDDQQHAGVPERQPRVDRGGRLPAHQQSSAFST